MSAFDDELQPPEVAPPTAVEDVTPAMQGEQAPPEEEPVPDQQPAEQPAADAPRQDYDYATLVAAAPSYTAEGGPTIRTWMVEGALHLAAHERGVKPRELRLTREEMLAALGAWLERPDPTYPAPEPAPEEAG